MKNISTQKERIIQYLKIKGISKNKFYITTGVSNGTLDKKSGLTGDSIEKFYSIYDDVNPEWLLTGKGNMLKDSNLNRAVAYIQPDIPPLELANPATEYKRIRLYDVAASAGFGSFDEMVSTEKVVGTYIIPDFKNADWMIYVRGSSMYPKYSSGDIIACRVLRESHFIQWNKVYVVATREQGILVKRLKKSDKENHIYAVSDNPTYDPFYIPNDEILGIALVVGVIRLE